MIERSGTGTKLRVRAIVGGRRRTIATCETYEEAAIEEAKFYAAVTRDTGETLAAFGDKVLDRRELGNAVRDPDTDRSRWDTHVAGDPLGEVPVREVRRRDVVEWLERVEAKPSPRGGRLSKQTAKNTLNLLRVVLRHAVDRAMLTENPAREVRVEQRAASAHVPWTFLTLDEQARLVAAAGEHGRIVAFAIGTGLRAGELCALRLCDVVTEGDDPHVVVRFGGPPREPTKTGQIRRVPLLTMALDAARAQVESAASPNVLGLLFPRPQGGYRDPAHVLRWDVWRAAWETAKIGRPLRWHDLRHTCASSLISGWWGRRWSLDEVQRVLGHASRSTTERYAHLCETAVAEAARETRARCPVRAQQASEAAAKTAMISLAPPREFESLTNGLGSQRTTGRSREVAGAVGTRWALHEAVAAGDAQLAAEKLDALQRRVLLRDDVRLALLVAQGGPLAIVRGLQLEALIAEAEGASPAREAAS